MGWIVEALAIGSLVGVSLGALGAGGSILMVPMLVYGLGVPVQNATGTSLAVVGLNAAAGAVDYLRRGRSLPRTGIAFGVSGVVAAFAGAWLNHRVPGELVLLLFGGLMLAAAWSMLHRRLGPSHVGFDEDYGRLGWLRLVAVGLGVGVLTGFFGIGGGFLIVPALVLVLGVPTPLAIGTSLLVISLNAVWGILGYLGFGGLDWTLIATVSIGGVCGVFAGSKLARHLPEQILRTSFAWVIVGLAVYTLVRSATALVAA